MTAAAFLIYALTEPSGEVRYIGQSSRGLARPQEHLFAGKLNRDTNKHKVNWIRKLQSQGLTCKILIVDEYLSRMAGDKEKLIADFKGLLPGTRQ